MFPVTRQGYRPGNQFEEVRGKELVQSSGKDMVLGTRALGLQIIHRSHRRALEQPLALARLHHRVGQRLFRHLQVRKDWSVVQVNSVMRIDLHLRFPYDLPNGYR